MRVVSVDIVHAIFAYPFFITQTFFPQRPDLCSVKSKILATFRHGIDYNPNWRSAIRVRCEGLAAGTSKSTLMNLVWRKFGKKNEIPCIGGGGI